MSQNQQPLTLNVPTGIGVNNRCKVRVRVTDNVGCQSPWFIIKKTTNATTDWIDLPTNSIQTQVINTTSGGQCFKKYTITGGIPPYTPTGGYIANTVYTVPCQGFILTASGVDSVGCPYTLP
jgi:hypothetical protein